MIHAAASSRISSTVSVSSGLAGTTLKRLGSKALSQPDDYFRRVLVWKFQRVAPYGSEVPRAKMVSALTWYTCHGGGPALGALYLAVRPPLTTVGSHPSFLNASAIRWR